MAKKITGVDEQFSKDIILLVTSGQIQFLPIFDALPIGVTIANSSGHIAYYNKMQAKIDGLQPAEAIGQHIYDVYSAGKQGESSVMMSCLESGSPIINKISIYRTPCGKLVNAAHYAFPLYVGDEMKGVILFLEPFSNQLFDTLQLSIHTQPVDHISFDSIVGDSPLFLRAKNIAKTVASSPSSVLICGETGTGKELFARSIHAASSYADGPYMTVNCAAIPATLLEGILFGTSKGAFTGALDKKGLFEEANNGVLYLDELDSMPIELQAKLLRTLQERKVRRVGSTKERPFKVKLVCSISDKPDIILEQKKLRPDIFFRVGVGLVELPRLSERLDDLEKLCDFFLTKHKPFIQREVIGISQEVIELFRQYRWPGNVRELEHIIEGALNLAQGYDYITPDMLPDYLYRELGQSPRQNAYTYSETTLPRLETLTWNNAENYNRKNLESALKKGGGNVSRAASLLGISRQLVTYHMRKHGLKREDYFF